MLMLSLFSARKNRILRALSLLLLPFFALSLLSFAQMPTKSASAGEAVYPPVTAPSTPVLSSSALSLSANAAVLMHADTGEVFLSHNADTRLPMASTTKIMTALVAIESAPLDTVIRVAPEAVGVEGSSVYLYEGETLTLETLLYALLLESANDAAVAIACGIAGSVDAFAALMNQKAAELGLKDTQFQNPHGLDHAEHYTTARELALITAVALKHDAFRTIVSTYKKTIPQIHTDGVRLMINHNRLISSYEGCIGVKTGYTRRSGRCLVTAAERDGLTLIAVTLSDPNDWKDHTALLDYGFSRYTSVPLTDVPITFTLPVLNGITATATVSYTPADGLPLRVTLPKDHGEITHLVELPRHLWGTYRKGDTVGRITFFCGNEPFCAFPLTLDTDVREISYRFRPIERIKAFFTG